AHPHQAVGHGEFAVQAEVDEARVGHGGTAENQGAILRPNGTSQKQKAAEAAFVRSSECYFDSIRAETRRRAEDSAEARRGEVDKVSALTRVGISLRGA
ncbi:MAG: hypothetical protein AB1418_02370, partial [Pseudomonadota bacterium]